MTTISPSVPAIGTDGDGNAIIAVPRGGKDQGDVNRVYVLSTGARSSAGPTGRMFKKDARRTSYSSTGRPGVAARSTAPAPSPPAVPRLPRPAGQRERPPLLVVPPRERQPDRSVGDPGVHGLERVRPGALAAGAGVRGADRPVADGLRRLRRPGRPLRRPARRSRTWRTRSSGRPGLVDRDGDSVAGKSDATFVRDTFRFVQGRDADLGRAAGRRGRPRRWHVPGRVGGRPGRGRRRRRPGSCPRST